MTPKRVMGADLPSEPPAPERQPPLRVEDSSPEAAPAPSAKAPPSRKDSPPLGMIRVQGKGWNLTMPHVALVAVLTTLGGWFGKEAVSKGEQAELADVLKEVRELRKDVRDLKADVADLADEQRKARGTDKAIVSYTSESLRVLVASVRRLGVKLEYDGREPDDVEFHPPPLSGTAPPIQPKATLPAKPKL